MIFKVHNGVESDNFAVIEAHNSVYPHQSIVCPCQSCVHAELLVCHLRGTWYCARNFHAHLPFCRAALALIMAHRGVVCSDAVLSNMFHSGVVQSGVNLAAGHNPRAVRSQHLGTHCAISKTSVVMGTRSRHARFASLATF